MKDPNIKENDWIARFRDFWYETGEFEGRPLGIEQYIHFFLPEIEKAYQRGRGENLYCQKTIEGDAICGCRLDCHLHDFRQTALKEVQEETFRFMWKHCSPDSPNDDDDAVKAYCTSNNIKL